MEQIVNSFLKQQGIEYIGSFDKENNVWIYIKNGEVHFCKSDLTPINKEAIGLGNDLLILTETDGCIHKIDDNESFSNFIVIDNNNKILVREVFGECDSSSKRGKDSYVLKRVNQDTFFLASESYLESCCFDDKDKTAMHSIYSIDRGNRKYSYLFKENKYMKNYHLGSYYKDFYFFKNIVDYSLTVLNSGNGHVSDEIKDGVCIPCLWIHKDAKAQIVFVNNDSDFVNNDIESKDNALIQNLIQSGSVKIVQLDNRFYTYNYRVSDYVLPSDVKSDNTELDYDYCSEPYNFLYTDNHIVLPFSQKYGAFVIEYTGDRFTAHSIIFDDYYKYYRVELHNQLIHLDKSQTYYDIYGNKLGSYEKHNYYMVYSDKKSLLTTSRNDEVKGVIGIWSMRIVVPPIFKEIEIIDDENGLFEVTYRFNGKNMQKETKGLYSADEGFIIPFGSEYDIIDYVSSPEKMIKKYVVYSQGNKKGVICNGKKLFNADFEYISKGCYIKNHSYFVAGKEGKEFIISDDSIFYEYRNTEYDSIFISNSIIEDNRFFIVEKEEKVGAICTNKEYNIPLIFDSITLIINSGVLCHHNVLYDRSGNEILSIGDGYNYIRTSNLDVFKSKTSEEFIFIDKRGDKLNYQRDEDDDNIIHVDGIAEPFDIEKGDFIEDEGEYNDYGPEYTQKDLDRMYREAYEGDPEAQWNTD